MNHPSAPPQRRRAALRTPRTRRTLARLGGLGVFLAAAIGLAPAAWATSPPPEASSAPVPPPPPTAAPEHFPLWAIAAILVATVVPSVATTLITLALEHTRRARRAPAAATRRYMIGAAVCGAVILAVMLGIVWPRHRPTAASPVARRCSADTRSPPRTTQGSALSSRHHNGQTYEPPVRPTSISRSSCALRGPTDMRPFRSTSGWPSPAPGTTRT